MRINFIVAFITALILTACGSKEAPQAPAPKPQLSAQDRAPIFKSALDYNAVPRIEGCTDEVPRDVKYHNCRDSKALYNRALSTAKAMDAPLMVIFGFNKCPYCIKLESEIMDLHARSDHGLALADELGVTEMAKAAGWHRVWAPFVVFVNPKTGEMTSESKWEAKEIYCDWAAGVATSLEKIGMAEVGEPVTLRKRCPKV